jgi:heme/copper-type cytochrome/quinol oxidase subunit 2
MNEAILIMIFIVMILLLVGVILAVYLLRKKKDEEKQEVNYQVFFTIGIVWVPLGIVSMIAINTAIGIPFLAIGLSWMAIGLANRDKWQNQ